MLSIIVPAHNEERLLGPTLDALKRAAATIDEPWEIVVVDDASTDCTVEIALAYGATVVPVAFRQIAATRNAGAKAARGDKLIFVDADTVVSAAAVRGAVRAMQNGAVGGGCAFRFDGGLPFYGRMIQAAATPLYRLFRLASGCFLFCTREAFMAVGGFDETLFAAEEATMSQALKRYGRFVVLRASVTTSGRKLRTHSIGEVFSILGAMARAGPNAFRKREGLDVWYGRRRDDPYADPSALPVD